MTQVNTVYAAARYILLGLACIALLSATMPAALASLPDPLAIEPPNPFMGALEGDYNQNGRLDFADVVGLFNYLGGDAEYLAHMDMNHNGRLDFADVVLLWGRL